MTGRANDPVKAIAAPGRGLGPRRLQGLVCLLVLLVCDQGALAQSEADQSLADGQVFKLRAGSQSGSAVLLHVDGDHGYFATCYHVLHGAGDFRIEDGSSIIADHTADARFYRRWSQDLVILRANLRVPAENRAARLRPVDLSSIVADSGEDVGTRVIEGLAFGYPGFDPRNRIAVLVRLQGVRQARYIGVLNLGATRPRGDDTDYTSPVFRFLGRELTYPGMSGGLVRARDGAFGGIVFGQGPGLIGLMIPARVVKEAFEKARSGPDGMSAYDPDAFAVPPPFNDAQKQALEQRIFINQLDWVSYEYWQDAIKDRPSQFIQAFQEISIRLDDLRAVVEGGAGDDAGLRVKPHLGADKVDLLLNGKPWDGTTGDPLPLQRGENLLVITRSDDGGGGLVLNRLQQPSACDLDFFLGDAPVYRLRRSLPAVVRKYSIYVTIHNGDQPAEMLPHNARLAVRLDFLQRLMNRVPLYLPIEVNDRNGSRASGRILFTGNNFLKLGYLSEQTLSLEARTELEVKEALLNFSGVRLSAHDKMLRATVRGRLQFPSDPKALSFVSARALGVDSGDPVLIRVPLNIGGGEDPPGDEGISLDLSGILRLALNCYLNAQLLRPNEARTPALDEVRRFFDELGFLSNANPWSLQPKAMFLKDPGEGPPWLVVIFAIERDGQPLSDTRPDTLPPEGERREVVFDLVAHGLPAIATNRYLAGDEKANPIVARLLTGKLADRVAVTSFRLSLSGSMAEGPVARDPVNLLDDENKLPMAFRKALDEFLDTSRKAIDLELPGDFPATLIDELLGSGTLTGSTPTVEGTFRVRARSSAAGNEIAVEAGRGGYSFRTARSLVFPKDIEVKEPSLHLEEAKIQGDPTKASFRGTMRGALVCGSASVLGRYRLQGFRCRFSVVIDSARPERAIEITILEPRGTYTVGNEQAPKQLPDCSFKFWISSEGKPDENFLQQILFND